MTMAQPGNGNRMYALIFQKKYVKSTYNDGFLQDDLDVSADFGHGGQDDLTPVGAIEAAHRAVDFSPEAVVDAVVRREKVR